MNEFDPQRFKTGCSRLSDRVRTLLEVTHVGQIPMYAAHACYFMVLAAFPMLLLVLSVLRYTPLQVDDLLELLSGVVPTALMGAVKRLVISTYDNASTAMVSVSAVAARWSARSWMAHAATTWSCACPTRREPPPGWPIA